MNSELQLLIEYSVRDIYFNLVGVVSYVTCDINLLKIALIL